MSTQTPKDPPDTGRGDKKPADGRQTGQGGPGLLVIGALLVALAAAGAAGWMWRQLEQTRQAQSELASAQARAVAELEAELARVSSSVSGLDDLNSAVGETAEQVAAEISDLRRDLGQLRSELLSQFNAGAQDQDTRLLLAEAEQLMRIAAYLKQLRMDPTGAGEALALADERLAAVEDPLVAAIRETLARERQALASVPVTDIAGTAAALSALAEQAATLPLRNNGEDTAQATSATEPGAGTDNGGTQPGDAPNRWTMLMDEIGQSLSQLVRVQKHDETMVALLTPDEEGLIRQNLQIKFETARLALLERRAQVYGDSLGEARRWLQTYFETTDASVNNALNETAALLTVSVEPVLPDISGSLRQLRAARETLNRVPAGGNGP